MGNFVKFVAFLENIKSICRIHKIRILFSSLDDVFPVRRYLKFETLVGKSLPNSPTVIDSLLLPARQALLKIQPSSAHSI
jgi:hypothetical protein